MNDNNSISRFAHILSRIRAYTNWYTLIWPFNRIGLPAKIIKVRNGPHISVRNIFGPDFVVVHEMFSRDDYNIKQLKLGDNAIILDIGANIGAFSLLAAFHFPGSKIFAFEPAETNFKVLKNNIELNSLGERIVPSQFAISFKEGDQEMTYSKDEYAHSLVAEQVTTDFERKGIVHCTTLEKIIENNNISIIDILKMDIEGLEYDVLFNLPDNVFSKIRYMTLEIHQHTAHTAEELISFLNTKNFSVENVPTHPRVYFAVNKKLNTL